MKKSLLFATALALLTACSFHSKTEKMSSIEEKTILTATDSILSRYPKADTALLKKGLRNAAGFWKKEDGTSEEFVAFCQSRFMATPEEKAGLFNTIDKNLEVIYGNFNKIGLDLKKAVQLAGPDFSKTDEDFGALDPYAHFADDMFSSKIAFTVLLNFPFYTLQEKKELGKKWSRLDWAYARLGDVFTARVPAEITQGYSTELAKTENYISEYNIRMDRLRTEDNRQLFADSMSLITHWGLRDELKADYADSKTGLEKQELIYTVMKHIIDQTIPEQIINNGGPTWKPVSNKVEENGKTLSVTPEPDTRYKRLFACYQASKAMDPYCLSYPTAIRRAFDRDMEVSVDDIERMFTQLISSPEVGQVAKLIKKRLGRDLRPFDIWYDGFKSRSSIPEDQLTAQTRLLYPDTKAFEKDMPNLLSKLGFAPSDAAFISSQIIVDGSRGSGHAAGALLRGDKARLRTRVQPGGMDYKGFNIAMHEFGHNVEQTLSLNKVDHYIMNGIPGTAFTEALAFVFQKRDLDMLGYVNNGADKQALQTLDIFWGCYEIMGVSLVEVRTWKWLYEHPEATPETLKANVIKNAKDIWNEFYAPHLGEKDSPVLAIYSHMIEYPLYLCNYPYGHIVEFQLEKHFGLTKPGAEIVRMYPTGRVLPDYWMTNAVGSAVSTQPMLEAVRTATAAIK